MPLDKLKVKDYIRYHSVLTYKHYDMRLPKKVEPSSPGGFRGNTLLVVLFMVMASPHGLSATPSLSRSASPNPFPGLVDIRSTDLANGTFTVQGVPATSSEETSPDRSAMPNAPTGEEATEVAERQPRQKGWHWEKATLFHFTNPASRPGIAASRAGQRLVKEFDFGLDLLTESLESEQHAVALRQESLAGLGEDKSGFQDLATNALPEPPPLVLFATGLACVLISRAVRKYHKADR